MPNTRLRRTYTVDSVSYADTTDISSESSSTYDGGSLPAAKTGQLTTRTNDTDGVITLTGGHGFSSGTHDVYWTGGARYGVTTSIATNACTISSGSGDNLPTNLTNVTVALPVTETFAVPANGAKSIIVHSATGKMRCTFRTSVPGNIYTVVHEGSSESLFGWDETTGGDNPLSTDAVATIVVSNGSSTAALTPTVKVCWTS